jgi:predicted nucleotidyltransferase component of viral defense system
MTAEKIRSLFQRTRARDLYDVRYILGRKLVEETVLRDILGKKCRLRQVPVDIVRLRARRTGYRDAWKASLAHQMKEVPDFDAAFDWVLAEVAKFE